MDKKSSEYQHTSQFVNGDEITLKEFILKLQEFVSELWQKKWWIIGISLFIALSLVLWNSRKETIYTSAVTFMVTESNDKGGLNSLLDQIQSEGITNNKITEIARASKIVHQVLLSEVVDGGLIAEKLIDVYRLKDKWGDINWDEIQLSSYQKINESLASKHVFNKLHELLVGNKLRSSAPGMMSISYDDKTEIFKLKIDAKEQILSSELVDIFYEKLSEFYTDKTVGSHERTFAQLKVREDSLQASVNDLEKNLAYARDRTRGVVSSISQINQNRLQRNLDQTTSLYNDVRTNRQKIEYVLQTETPDFQILDQTFVPIIVKPSLLKSGMLGFFTSGIVCCIFIICRYLVMQALKA